MTIDEEIQDEDLVRCIREGDTNQFGLLAKRYASKIYGLAMQLMRNPADAEDAVQEAFLVVYTKLDSFRGESAFGSWFYKDALNSICTIRTCLKKILCILFWGSRVSKTNTPDSRVMSEV